MERRRAEHVTENRELVQHRMHSLQVSHRARCGALKDRIDRATEPRIRRMREAELARANDDCERRVAELERLAESADIHATLAVAGTMQIVRSAGE